MAIAAAMGDIKAGKAGPIPRELQNVHADGERCACEREQGYLYPHDYREPLGAAAVPAGHAEGSGSTMNTAPNKTEQAAKRYWDELRRMSGEKRVDG